MPKIISFYILNQLLKTLLITFLILFGILFFNESIDFLEKAAKDKFLLFLQHDVKNEVIDIRKENDKFKLNKTFKLEDI